MSSLGEYPTEEMLDQMMTEFDEDGNEVIGQKTRSRANELKKSVKTLTSSSPWLSSTTRMYRLIQNSNFQMLFGNKNALNMTQNIQRVRQERIRTYVSR